MLVPLFTMALGFTTFFVTVLILRVRAELMLRKARMLRLAQVEA
jgi:heme exporter protein C